MAFGYAVYFTERLKNRVVRWDPDSGDVDVAAGEPADGDPSQTLKDPYGLAFDLDGNLLIADKLHHRVVRLKDGRLDPLAFRDVSGHRARLPISPRSYEPTLICPTGLVVEPSGAVLCTFADDYTIYRIFADGALELVLGMVRNRRYYFGEPRETVPPPEAAGTPICAPTGIVRRADGTIFFIERQPQLVREYHPSRGLRSVFSLSQRHAFALELAAPEAATVQTYHPSHPGGLALDGAGNLYVTDVRHGSVVRVDETGQVRKVAECRSRLSRTPAGIAALAFGPDGTAWVLDGGAQAVLAYEQTPSGRWRSAGPALNRIRGEPLALPEAGSGIVTG